MSLKNEYQIFMFNRSGFPSQNKHLIFQDLACPNIRTFFQTNMCHIHILNPCCHVSMEKKKKARRPSPIL